MRRMNLQVGACIAIFGLVGCGGEPAGRDAVETEPKPGAAGSAAVARPVVVDGYQIVRVIVRNTGYEPDRIELQAGTPAKVVFVQEADSHCASQIQIPDFGVPVTDLPRGKETVVEFAPNEAGTYTFTCGMDMMRGTIVVRS